MFPTCVYVCMFALEYQELSISTNHSSKKMYKSVTENLENVKGVVLS